MKILFFVEVFLPKAQTFILNQVRWFNTNVDVQVVCTEKIHNESEFDFKVKQIDFQDNFFLKSSRRLWFNRYSPKFKSKLNQCIADFKPDVIHCHFGTQALTLIDNIENKSIPICVTLHGYDITQNIKNSKLYTYKLRQVFKQSNIHPIFVCKYHKDHLLKLNISSSNAIILYNGIYIDFFKRKDYPESKDVVSFLQVSRFVGKKGHKFTVEAFNTFFKNHPNSKVKLKFIGDGPLKEETDSLIKKYHLEDKIQIINWLDPQGIKKELELAQYYVQHSIISDNGDQEATSVSILEAMAMELPILSTYHAGIPEVITHEENGILVEERNIKQFSQAIEDILKFSYSPINRKKVEEKFNLEVRNEKLFAHYKKISANNPNRSK